MSIAVFFLESTSESSAKTSRKTPVNFINTPSSMVLEGKQYASGGKFSIADAYLFTILNRSGMHKIDLANWPNIKAYQARIPGQGAGNDEGGRPHQMKGQLPASNRPESVLYADSSRSGYFNLNDDEVYAVLNKWRESPRPLVRKLIEKGVLPPTAAQTAPTQPESTKPPHDVPFRAHRPSASRTSRR
jgi:hypothetical protein